MIKVANNRQRRRNIRSVVRWSIAALLLATAIYCIVVGSLRFLIQSYSDELFVTNRMRAANALLAVDVLRVYAMITIARDGRLDRSIQALRSHRDTIRDVVDTMAPQKTSTGQEAMGGGVGAWISFSADVTSLIRRLSELKPSGSIDPRMTINDINWLRQLDSEIGNSLFESIRKNLNNSWNESNKLGQKIANLWFLLLALTFAYAIVLAVLIATAANAVYSHIATRRSEIATRLHMLSRTEPPFHPVPLKDDEFGEIDSATNNLIGVINHRISGIVQERAALVHDLSEKSHAIRKLDSSFKRAGRALVQFVTDISHDIRTPLAIIKGECEVTLRGKPNSADDYHQTLRRVVAQTHYIASLVDQLLLAARSRVFSQQFALEKLNFVELVEAACVDMMTLANNRNVRLVQRRNTDYEVVLGDETRLREMVLAVLDNAINYSQPSSEIYVDLERGNGNALSLTVSDTGIGIPAADLPNIFRRFYRGEEATLTNAAGTGIGLAIVKSIVEAHGGKVDIASEEGKGTNVALTLFVEPTTNLEINQ